MSNYVFPQLSSDQMISIIRNGFQKTHIPKKIIIVGAGMAGLVAASLLKQAGHNVTILEASERGEDGSIRCDPILGMSSILKLARCVSLILIF